MPGRGRFWGVGALNDEIVEEADLTQAVQTKLNTGGGGSGNWEKVGDVTVSGGPVQEQDVTLSRTVALDGTDVSQVVVVVSTLLTSGSGISYQFNNISTGTNWTCTGNDIGNVSYTQFSESDNVIFTDKGYGLNKYIHTIIEGNGKATNSGWNGHIRESQVSTAGATGMWVLDTTISALTSFKLISKGTTNIADGTHIVVYAVTLN